MGHHIGTRSWDLGHQLNDHDQGSQQDAIPARFIQSGRRIWENQSVTVYGIFVTWVSSLSEALPTHSKNVEDREGRQAWERGTVTNYGRLAPSGGPLDFLNAMQTRQ